MPASDHDLVSQEEHEISHILKHYNMQSNEITRNVVKNLIKAFKKDGKSSPYYHKNLYRFVDDGKYPDFFIYKITYKKNKL